MTRRTSYVAAAIVLLLLLAIASGYWLTSRPSPEETAVPTGDSPAIENIARESPESESAATEGAAAPAEGGETATVEAPPAGTVSAKPDEAPTPAEAVAGTASSEVSGSEGEKEGTEKEAGPSFDVVRVERSGEAVIAGRAAPGSEVTITSDGEDLGRTRADARGEWVFLPDRPLPSGDHELAIVSRDSTGEEAQSQQVVVVSVPETPEKEQEGAEPAGSESAHEQAAAQPLAVSLPRSGEGEARVLQGGGSGISVGNFVLESILYDETGRLTVGGRVPPDGRVFTYIDQGFVGEALGNHDGRWVLAASEPVSVGLHRLRVDHVDASGKVLARIETPFARSQLIADLPDRDRFVVVQPGNSLWRIARRVYGKGLQYGVLFDANRDQIRDPDLIYPGQIFQVPSDG